MFKVSFGEEIMTTVTYNFTVFLGRRANKTKSKKYLLVRFLRLTLKMSTSKSLHILRPDPAVPTLLYYPLTSTNRALNLLISYGHRTL